MDWFTLETILELALGISLSAAAGFRVFVPLLILSSAAVLGHFDLPSQLDWAETPTALAVLAAASALEIGGYYLPWFDHALDLVATPAAILMGTIVSASLVPPDVAPVAQWTLAIAAGGGTAGLTKTLANILRAASTAVSGGLTNPLLATIELLAAVGLSVLAITVPLLAVSLVLIVLLAALQKLWQLFLKVQAETKARTSKA